MENWHVYEEGGKDDDVIKLTSELGFWVYDIIFMTSCFSYLILWTRRIEKNTRMLEGSLEWWRNNIDVIFMTSYLWRHALATPFSERAELRKIREC